MTTRALSLLILLPAALAGCALAPTPLRGDYAAVEPEAVTASGRSGDRVRWGGRVIEVEPGAEQTCLQVLSQALGPDGRPRRRGDDSGGRFLACRDGFYDPEIFTAGRQVTITGTVVGTVQRRVGEFDYAMPQVAADVFYLWSELIDDPYDWHGGVWFSPWPYGPGWYGWHHRWHPKPRPLPPPRSRSRAVPPKDGG